jgi:hypothetical protein
MNLCFIALMQFNCSNKLSQYFFTDNLDAAQTTHKIDPALGNL